MGSYSNPDPDNSTDETPAEQNEDTAQTGIDEFEDGNDGSEGSSDTDSPDVGSGGAAGGVGGAVVTEAPESTSADPEDDTTEDQPSEDSDPEHPDDDRQVEESTERAETDSADDTDSDETVLIVQEVDPLSAMSWCMQPIMARVAERYEDVEIIYQPAPVRAFDDPATQKQQWEACQDEFEMPVDPTFWDENPPESTERLQKAFGAAIKQGGGRKYLRALWRRAIAAGEPMVDDEVLLDLATEIGLDRERFAADMETIDPDMGGETKLPVTRMEINGKPVEKRGRLRYSDLKPELTFQGLTEDQPQSLTGFVADHSPVATAEVMETYESSREEAVQRLEGEVGLSLVAIGGEQFWTS